MREKSNFLAYIFLLLTVTFWAGNFIVGKFASHYEVPPFSLNFYRWFFSWLILAPFTLPAIIKKKNTNEIKFFENIGSDIGLLFQIADDLIDFKGNSKIAGKKTGKDQKIGKATLIRLLGYMNAIKYCDRIILKINHNLKKYGSNSKNIRETLNYILNREK